MSQTTTQEAGAQLTGIFLTSSVVTVVIYSSGCSFRSMVVAMKTNQVSKCEKHSQIKNKLSMRLDLLVLVVSTIFGVVKGVEVVVVVEVCQTIQSKTG